MVIIKKILPIIIFLSLNSGINAASFKLSPTSGTFNQNCASSVDIILDAEGGSTNAADIIIDYDPAKVEVTQIKTGTVYTDYFGNVVDNTSGVIRLTGASFVGTFTSSGVFATIQFKPKSSNTSSSFNIRFTGASPYNTLDSNIADTNTSNDILSSVQNGTYNFGSGSCVSDSTPPAINFQNPVNNQKNVPADANIQVQITDDGSGVNINTVEIIINGVTYKTSSPRATTTGNSSSYLVTIQPYDPLFTSQTNTVLVKASDFAGNSQQGSINFNIPTITPTIVPTITPTSTPGGPTSVITPRPTATVYATPTQFSCPVVPTAPTYPDSNSPIIEFVRPQERGEVDAIPQIIINLSDLGSGIDINTIKINFDNYIFTHSDPQFSFSGNPSSYLIKLQLDRSFPADSQHVVIASVSDLSGNGISKSINIKIKPPFANQILEFFYPDSTKRGRVLNLIPFILIGLLLIPLFYLLRRSIVDHRLPCGYVFNSTTLEPVSGVTIDIFDSSPKKIKTVTTNLFGVFAAKIPADKYQFVPRSPYYSFPSVNKHQLNFPHPYSGQITSDYQDIPIDPLKKPPFSFLPPLGTITDNNKEPQVGLKLGLRDIRFDTLIATRVTDSLGQYRFLIPHGHYQLVDIDHQDKILATIDTRHRIGGYTTINQDLQVAVSNIRRLK